MRGGIAFLCALAAVTAGCGGDDEPELRTTIEAEAEAPRIGAGQGGIRLQEIGDFEEPLYVTQPPEGGELYVVERGGTVRVVRDGRTLPDPFLDISDRVSTFNEQGLLSIAFAPDFADSRLLYAYFTDSGGDQRVIELRANGDGTRVEAESEREVLQMEDFAVNHNGGLLLFGPDGLLYIGTGDGGGSGDPERNGQDLSSLLGKLLRIDPRESGGRPYSVPDSNPFVGQEGARPEIFAYGLRNPWRFSFDPETGALSIGDVGQDAFEEIDFVSAARARGANFGWSAFEAGERFNEDQSAPGHIRPVLAYGRDVGCSVSGGFVVRDRSLRPLYGRYIYGDYCSGELRSFVPPRARDDRPLGLSVPDLTSFGEDAERRIYVTSFTGSVFRLAPG